MSRISIKEAICEAVQETTNYIKRKAVTCDPQNFTASQKAQIKKNIGITDGSASDTSSTVNKNDSKILKANLTGIDEENSIITLELNANDFKSRNTNVYNFGDEIIVKTNISFIFNKNTAYAIKISNNNSIIGGINGVETNYNIQENNVFLLRNTEYESNGSAVSTNIFVFNNLNCTLIKDESSGSTPPTTSDIQVMLDKEGYCVVEGSEINGAS